MKYRAVKNIMRCGLLMLLAMPSLLWANQLNSVRLWPSPDNTRVVLDLSASPDYSYFRLSSPERLVIDIKQTGNRVNFSQLKHKQGLVNKVRLSTPPKKGTLRVVLELTKPIKPVIFPLSPTKPYGDRLVIDLFDTEQQAKVSKTITAAQKTKQDRDIIIAIDAGHGGEDPGSIGPGKRYEKRVTLAIAKELAALINAQRGLKAVMIRTGDYFVNLNRRSELARKHGADLLLSIHADAYSTPQPRGASVWVLSRKRANTEIGRWLEQTEKHSELLGGAAEVIQDSGNEKYVARALLDMSMDHSLVESHDVAKRIVKEMGRVTKMHKKTPVSASFAVLKSPDIPSLLIETGFISNPQEAKLLSSKSHQRKLAKAIFNGVNAYFKAKPPEGALYANKHKQTHVVKKGESLSRLAKRYHTSVAQLKKTNKLKRDTLFVGQVLTIPRS